MSEIFTIKPPKKKKKNVMSKYTEVFKEKGINRNH